MKRQNSDQQHEAGDRVYVISSQFSEFVAEHPFVKADPELARQVAEIEDQLGALYQAIWNTSVDASK